MKTKQEYFKYLIECGFEENELEAKWQDVLYVRERMVEREKVINGYGEATTRVITTSTYERAKKKKEEEVSRFLGNR